MYSVKPILHSINVPEDIIQTANCGLSVEAENSELIKEAILQLSRMNKNDLEKMGQSGKNYVIENHSYSNLAKQYREIF